MSDELSTPDELLYSRAHEWVRVEGDIVVIGITDFAQNSLHEITFVEVSEAGTVLETNAECGLVESMKASSEIYTPIAGEIVEVNPSLEDSPEVVNESPYDKGWLMKIKPSNLESDKAQLLDAKGYLEYVQSL